MANIFIENGKYAPGPFLVVGGGSELVISEMGHYGVQ